MIEDALKEFVEFLSKPCPSNKLERLLKDFLSAADALQSEISVVSDLHCMSTISANGVDQSV